MRCGHKWRAPYLLPPPSTKVRSVEQTCILDRGHAGPHRSATNVVTPADKRT